MRVARANASAAQAIGFAAVAFGLLIWTTWQQVDLYATGCDSFGYARQAELFRQNGILAGLDTRLDSSEASFIIGVAKSITPDSEKWYEAVAPHCHHYVASVDRVILEYPPGTGLALSIFPANLNLEYVFVLAMMLVAAAFVGFAATRRPSWFASIVALATLALIDWTMRQTWATASASIAVSIACIPLSAALAFFAFPASGKRADPFLALGVGLLCGLLLVTRLANIFLLAGIACQIAINGRFWRWQSIGQSSPALVSALLGFCFPGAALLLSANRINAGSMFATTYSPIDASPPVFDPASLADHVAYYFGSGFAWPAAVGALVLFALRLLTLRQYPPEGNRFGASIGAFACFLLSIAFFGTHAVKAQYYLLPASVFALCLLSFELLDSRAHRRAVRARAFGVAFAILPLAMVAIVRLVIAVPVAHKAILPDEVRTPEAILWGDVSTGTAVFYQSKYAAKLIFAASCLQDRLALEVSRTGRAQYFIEDSPAMEAVVARIGGTGNLRQIGVFDTYNGRFPVWKLDGGSDWPTTSC